MVAHSARLLKPFFSGCVNNNSQSQPIVPCQSIGEREGFDGSDFAATAALHFNIRLRVAGPPLGARPTKPASWWRSLMSFLGAGATEESIEVALARLIGRHRVAVLAISAP